MKKGIPRAATLQTLEHETIKTAVKLFHLCDYCVVLHPLK